MPHIDSASDDEPHSERQQDETYREETEERKAKEAAEQRPREKPVPSSSLIRINSRREQFTTFERKLAAAGVLKRRRK